MDVFITPEARREIEALRVARPTAATWGFLVGHKRGFRFIVEKVFPAGSGRALPDERVLAGLDRIWPGGVIGLFAVRLSAPVKKAVLGPMFYGKLVLELGSTARKQSVRSFVVEFKRKFFLSPVPLVPAVKAKAHE
ncbi:MAG: hypothetical protein IMZ54_01945 [Acidobacteria bacterium]|nr:hypothetical protein [Acidobacteriota bacterium]